MGRASPIFNCGSTDIVEFSNHLAQVYGMGVERAKWLNEASWKCMCQDIAEKVQNMN